MHNMFNRRPSASGADALSLEKCASRAFSMQTLKKGEYVKSDVQAAREALDGYSESKTLANLEAAVKAVEECVKNNRSGFNVVAKALAREPKPEEPAPAKGNRLGR